MIRNIEARLAKLEAAFGHQDQILVVWRRPKRQFPGRLLGRSSFLAIVSSALSGAAPAPCLNLNGAETFRVRSQTRRMPLSKRCCDVA
jgi:hypothetical protein